MVLGRVLVAPPANQRTRPHYCSSLLVGVRKQQQWHDFPLPEWPNSRWRQSCGVDPHHTVRALKLNADNLQVNKHIVVAAELYFHTANLEDVAQSKQDYILGVSHFGGFKTQKCAMICCFLVVTYFWVSASSWSSRNQETSKLNFKMTLDSAHMEYHSVTLECPMHKHKSTAHIICWCLPTSACVEQLNSLYIVIHCHCWPAVQPTCLYLHPRWVTCRRMVPPCITLWLKYSYLTHVHITEWKPKNFQCWFVVTNIFMCRWCLTFSWGKNKIGLQYKGNGVFWTSNISCYKLLK